MVEVFWRICQDLSYKNSRSPQFRLLLSDPRAAPPMKPANNSLLTIPLTLTSPEQGDILSSKRYATGRSGFLDAQPLFTSLFVSFGYCGSGLNWHLPESGTLKRINLSVFLNRFTNSRSGGGLSIRAFKRVSLIPSAKSLSRLSSAFGVLSLSASCPWIIARHWREHSFQLSETPLFRRLW